jgi:DNA-binding protein HU-beta
MTKADLVDKVHELSGGATTKKATGEIVDATFAALAEAIKSGRFSYPGFGTFSVRSRPARKGLNPRTKKPIDIAASKSVGFKAAPKLKDSI